MQTEPIAFACSGRKYRELMVSDQAKITPNGVVVEDLLSDWMRSKRLDGSANDKIFRGLLLKE